MNPSTLNTLREGGPECPSDFALDAYFLDQTREGPVAEHVERCDLCTERLESRAQGFQAFPEANPEALLLAVDAARRGPSGAATGERHIDAPDAPELAPVVPLRRRWRGTPILAGVGAMAALAAAILLVPTSSTELSTQAGGVRTKLAPTLYLHRHGAAGASRVSAGESLAPGDRIRFEIDLPEAGQVAILGLEASGAFYGAWPEPGTVGSAHREAGAAQLLEGAVALDESQGEEAFFLVRCDTAAQVARCVADAADGAPGCPAGCVVDAFPFRKAASQGMGDRAR